MFEGALAALDQALEELPARDRPAAIVALSARVAALGARLVEAPAERWLTLSEAADVARAPERRIRSWARGKAWAANPGGRGLLIEEAGFRSWLARPRSQRAAAVPNRALRAL
jgi:hypothetical protein